MIQARHLINGCEEHLVDVGNRGLQYGDGCFETIAIRDGRPLLWQPHVERLRRGLMRLGIDLDFSDDGLEDECRGLADGTDRAILKLTVTRGTGERGYRARPGVRTTRITSLYPWPDLPARIFQEGMRLCLCRTRVSRNRRLAGIKHLNCLPQVLARNEWDDEYDEGVMLDESDHVVEGTMTNIFLQVDGRLVTPRLDEAGVEGVMRQQVLREARDLGYDCAEEDVTLAILERASGMILTNSVLGVMGVAEFDDRTLSKVECLASLRERLRDVVAT